MIMRKRIGIACLVALGLQAVPADGSLGGDLQPVYPVHADHVLSDVCWTGSHFVAVGGRNNILTSWDGRNWIARQSPDSSVALNCVAGFDRQVVACGGGGAVLLSMDGGDRWSVESSGQEGDLYDVVHTGSRYLAVGTAGTIVSSVNGVDWSSHDSGTTNVLSALTSDGSVCIAVGVGPTILRSIDDGVTWSPVPSPTGSGILSAVTCNRSGLFVAAGAAGLSMCSTDHGQTWKLLGGTPSGAVNLSSAVLTDGAAFTFGSAGSIFRAEVPGWSWERIRVGLDDSIRSVASDGSQLIAVGAKNLVESLDPLTLAIEEHSPVPFHSLQAVTAHQGVLWAVGDYGTLVSSDDEGLTWMHASGSSNQQFSAVAVSASGILVTSVSGLHWSRDGGGSWQDFSLGQRCESVIVSGSTWLVGSIFGRILRSTDEGETWTTYQHSVGNAVFQAIIEVGGRLIAVGSGGIILTSDDGGVSWTARSSGVTKYLNAIVEAGPYLFAAGEGGAVTRSADGGDSWVPLVTGSNAAITGLAWTGQSLMAVTAGNYPGGGENLALMTTDAGGTWELLATGVDEDLQGILWIGGRLVCVGEGGRVTLSDAVGEGMRTLPFWRKSYPNLDPEIHDVERHGERFIAVGEDGLILDSEDQGRTWIRRQSGTNEKFLAVASNGSSLYAVTGGGSALVGLFESTDSGVSWTRLNTVPSSRYVRDIACGDGRILLRYISDFFESTDGGQTWVDVGSSDPVPYGSDSIDWDGAYFWMAAPTYQTASFSADGRSWTTITTLVSCKRIVAAGDDVIAVRDRTGMLISTDRGANWTTGSAASDSLSFTSAEFGAGGSSFFSTIDGAIHLGGVEIDPGLDFMRWVERSGIGAGVSAAEYSPISHPDLLLRFALDVDGDGSLSIAERNSLPRVTTESGLPTLRFSLPSEARSDLVIRIEHSASLLEGDWSPVARRRGAVWSGPSLPEVIADDGSTRQYRMAVPQGSASGFYRLVVGF